MDLDLGMLVVHVKKHLDFVLNDCLQGYIEPNEYIPKVAESFLGAKQFEAAGGCNLTAPILDALNRDGILSDPIKIGEKVVCHILGGSFGA